MMQVGVIREGFLEERGREEPESTKLNELRV